VSRLKKKTPLKPAVVTHYSYDVRTQSWTATKYSANVFDAMSSKARADVCYVPRGSASVVMASAPHTLRGACGPCPLGVFYLPRAKLGFIVHDELYGVDEEKSKKFIEDAVALVLAKAREHGVRPDEIKAGVVGGNSAKAKPALRRLEELIVENKMNFAREATDPGAGRDVGWKVSLHTSSGRMVITRFNIRPGDLK